MARRISTGPSDSSSTTARTFRLASMRGPLGKLLEGWQLSGVTTVQDGAPMTFVDGAAGSAYGTQGTGTTSGFRARANVPRNDLWQHRNPRRHRIPPGRIQRRPGLFQRQRFLPRAGHHAGRSNHHNASRLSYLRHAVRELRTWAFFRDPARSTLTFSVLRPRRSRKRPPSKSAQSFSIC